jgi:hypothetical protein
MSPHSFIHRTALTRQGGFIHKDLPLCEKGTLPRCFLPNGKLTIATRGTCVKICLEGVAKQLGATSRVDEFRSNVRVDEGRRET